MVEYSDEMEQESVFKCLKMSKKFMVMTSNVHNLKNIQLTVIKDERNRKTFTFGKLKVKRLTLYPKKLLKMMA